MATGVLANEFLDNFPASTRAGSGVSGPRETNVDIALKALQAEGAPSRVLKFLDYNFERVLDADGKETGEQKPVDEATARSRASGRVTPLKKRGYTIENGWVVVARDGAVYAKWFGAGNVPENYVRKTKPVGEEISV
jgi:hypothetical protein